MNSTVEAADLLVKSGINLFAVDFDCTLISFHTGGRWKGGPEELADGVRLVFSDLFPLLVERDISIAIVTFSGQTELIKAVLQIAFPSFHEKIVVRARDNSWGAMGNMSMDGKQKNMASAASEFSRMYPGKIYSRDSTILIDDDVNNINIALNNSVRALYFNPDAPMKLIDDIKELGSLQLGQVQHSGFQP